MAPRWRMISPNGVLLDFFCRPFFGSRSAHILCFLLRKREFGGDVAVFNNAVLIPKSKNMAKSMVDFSDYPAILFAMFRRGSISDPSGVDMALCRSVAILLNREAGVFFRESPPSALRIESV